MAQWGQRVQESLYKHAWPGVRSARNPAEALSLSAEQSIKTAQALVAGKTQAVCDSVLHGKRAATHQHASVCVCACVSACVCPENRICLIPSRNLKGRLQAFDRLKTHVVAMLETEHRLGERLMDTIARSKREREKVLLDETGSLHSPNVHLVWSSSVGSGTQPKC